MGNLLDNGRASCPILFLTCLRRPTLLILPSLHQRICGPDPLSVASQLRCRVWAQIPPGKPCGALSVHTSATTTRSTTPTPSLLPSPCTTSGGTLSLATTDSATPTAPSPLPSRPRKSGS